MPHVAVASTSLESRLADASARWAAIVAGRPQLEPAVALQRQLLELVVQLASAVEKAPRPRLSLPPRYLAAKLAQGVPALAGEPIPLPVALLTPALLGMCDALARGGAGAAAEHVRAILAEGRMDAGSLLSASVARNQDAVRTGALHQGLAPDLLWLIAELVAGPYVHVLQQALLAPDDPALRAALAGWNHGYCPVCGSWPALAEVAASHRVLRCSFCASAWEMNTYACIYCGDDGDQFVTAAPDQERMDRRLEVCRTCTGYLKTVDVAALSPFPLLAIADLETMDLDVSAMEHGYARPRLKDFASRR